MAKKVSELDAVSAIETNDLLEIQQDQGGGSYVSKKITHNDFYKSQTWEYSIENPLGLEPGDGKRVFVPVGKLVSNIRILSYWGSSDVSVTWHGYTYVANGDTTFPVSVLVSVFPQLLEFNSSGSYGVLVQFS